MKVSGDFILETKICKNDIEAINSRDFLRGLDICLKMTSIEDKNNYLGIIKKLIAEIPIMFSEFKSLENLLNNPEFLKITKGFFNKHIIFSGTKEEMDKFPITHESLKQKLTEIMFVNLCEFTKKEVDDKLTNKESELLKDKEVLKNDFIKIYYYNSLYYIKNTITRETRAYEQLDLEYLDTNGLILAREKGKNFIILNTKGEQVSKNRIFQYENIDFSYFDKTNLIVADLSNGKNESIQKDKVLLDKNGVEITDVGKSYSDFDFEQFEDVGVIPSKESTGGWVLLDKKGKYITEKGNTFDEIDFDYFKKLGLIVLEKIGVGKILIDKDGKIKLKNGEYYTTINLKTYKKEKVIIAKNNKGENILFDNENNEVFRTELRIKYSKKKKQFYVSK
ncbi:MAG: hypothetical protein PHN31_04060 [Candidatus Gracilibacteria bacterium]|nr:hypothetical protein [Candidatus Gracilibacteria bacterium]